MEYDADGNLIRIHGDGESSDGFGCLSDFREREPNQPDEELLGECREPASSSTATAVSTIQVPSDDECKRLLDGWHRAVAAATEDLIPAELLGEKVDNQLKVGTAGNVLRVTSGKSLCIWFGFEIAASNLLEIRDRLRVRQSSRVLCQELPPLPMGHQAVARNNRVIMRYLSFQEEAKLAISCIYLAKVFDDSSRSLYWHAKSEHDIRYRRENQDHEYISDGPDYYYGDSDSAEPLFDNRSRFEFIPSEDAEDDAAWS